MGETKDFFSQSTDIVKRRLMMVGLIFGGSMVVYLIYLFSLQIVHGGEYMKKATEVAQRETIIPPQRGEIYDRNFDVPLVMNIPSFAVNIIPSQVSDSQRTQLYEDLSEILHIPVEQVEEKIPPSIYHFYKPIEVKDAVEFNLITYIAEHVTNFPGVTWHNKPIRSYLESGSISHILGYVGTITIEDLQVLYNKGYQRSSTIGKAGVEKQYDAFLRGIPGRSFHTVDVRGKSIDTGQVRDISPENGKKVILTLDRRFQTLAEKALGDRMGSVVILKPNTGEILAMVSYPWIDPNLLYTDQRAEVLKKLSQDRRFPFLNRAIQSSYAPASTFKTIMTTAIIEEEVFPLRKKVLCKGKLWYGDRYFHCHRETGHGALNLQEALAESCNVFFFTVGAEYLGIERIVDYGRRFGYGEKTGIDLPGEIGGIMPSAEWKAKNLNSSWVGGDTLNTSIGQGYLSATPLQVANSVAMIVNEGKIYRPRILKEIRDPQSNALVEKVEPEVLKNSSIRPATFRLIKDYMRGTITKGTARWVITTQATKVAGKTGTGEVGLKDRWTSWFAAYAPYKAADPDDVVVVVVNIEGTNEWDWWAPKAADIIFQGIFAHQTYEEVIEEFEDRWYLKDR